MARAFFVKCIIMNATLNDAFAKFIGIKIVQATPQCAICELELTSNHLNGVGVVQGGVRTTALYNVSVVEKDSGVLLANFQGTAFRIK